MDPKATERHPPRKERFEGHREEVQMTIEARVGVMLPQAKEYQGFVAIAQKLEEAKQDSYLEIL